MFERYSEQARRVIFFARYEASGFGSPYIETEHLLLGLLREDKELAARFRQGPGGIEEVRRRIEVVAAARAATPVPVDLPLSQACRYSLVKASEAADAMGQREIGIGHLALGLLSEKDCLAAEILRERGLG